jgi:glycosyltransferase involved in cell wall biosynthesis
LPLARNLALAGNEVKVYAVVPIYDRNAYTVDYSGCDAHFGFNDRLELKNVDSSLAGYLSGAKLIPFFHNGKLKKNFLKDIAGSFIFKKRLLSENYDVIHLIGTNSLCLYLQFLLGKKISVQTLHEVTAHEASSGFKTKLLLRLLWEKPETQIIVHSQTSLGRLNDYYRLTKKKIRKGISCIPFGLFETNLLYSTQTVEEEDNTIVFWGRITPYKGIDVLREAFGSVRRAIPEARLIIAGEGKIEAAGKDEKNLEIINKNLTTSEIIELNQRAAIVVCPYTSASQSGIPMVTFLFGKPVVASRVGAFGEIIKNGENGLLVEKQQPAELAQALIKLLKNKNLRKTMSENIGNQFQDDNSPYAWKNIAQQTIEVYKTSKK